MTCFNRDSFTRNQIQIRGARYHESDVLKKEFGIDVDATRFAQVDAHVLKPPSIQYRQVGGVLVSPFSSYWPSIIDARLICVYF